MRPILAGLALLAQVLVSNSGHALELGDLTVASKLNEPLRASIEVKGVATDSTANTLVVSLASAQAHAAAGIPLDPATTNLIFTLDMLSRPAMVE
ncbi:MAG: type IV pilus assembly protein FimV, partial [Arenicellales bacterium]